MPGVPRKLAEHSLKVNKDAKPVKQGLRRLGTEKRKAVGKEILRLTAANSSEKSSTLIGWQIPSSSQRKTPLSYVCALISPA